MHSQLALRGVHSVTTRAGALAPALTVSRQRQQFSIMDLDHGRTEPAEFGFETLLTETDVSVMLLVVVGSLGRRIYDEQAMSWFAIQRREDLKSRGVCHLSSNSGGQSRHGGGHTTEAIASRER